MSDSNSTSAPAGTRYVTITADDRSGHLWVLVCLCLGFSFCALFARVMSKFRFSFKFGEDDYLVVVALGLLIIQCSLVIASLVWGLGKNENLVDPSRIDAMYRMFLASQAFLYASLYALKCSMVFLVMRLFNKKMHYAWMVFAVLGVVSIIVVTAGCSQFYCHNSGPIARWTILTVLDAGTELALSTLPFLYLSSIQMKRSGKIKVLLSLNVRLITVVFAALNLATIIHTVRSSEGDVDFSHPTTSVVIPALYLEAELAFSFLAASVLPCFRLLFSSSETERVAMDDAPTIGSWDRSHEEKRRAELAANPQHIGSPEIIDTGPRTDLLRPKTTSSQQQSDAERGRKASKSSEKKNNKKSKTKDEKSQRVDTHNRDSSTSSRGSRDSWPPFPRPESRQASLHTKDSQTPMIVAAGQGGHHERIGRAV